MGMMTLRLANRLNYKLAANPLLENGGKYLNMSKLPLSGERRFRT